MENKGNVIFFLIKSTTVNYHQLEHLRNKLRKAGLLASAEVFSFEEKAHYRLTVKGMSDPLAATKMMTANLKKGVLGYSHDEDFRQLKELEQ